MCFGCNVSYLCCYRLEESGLNTTILLAEFGGSFSFEFLPILEKLGSTADESFDGDLLLLTPRNLVSTVKYLPNVGLLLLSCC